MKTATIKISTKKGQTQETKWIIAQAHPYPDIEKAGSWRWRNADELFDTYQHPAAGLGNNYYCELLRSDIPADGHDRKSFAGFDGNPGTITLRGVNLGEMRVDVNENGYNKISVRGFETTTPGEKAFITAAIIPGLLAAIEESKAELKAEAVEAVRACIVEHVRDARAEIDKLEAEALGAIKKL